MSLVYFLITMKSQLQSAILTAVPKVSIVTFIAATLYLTYSSSIVRCAEDAILLKLTSRGIKTYNTRKIIQNVKLGEIDNGLYDQEDEYTVMTKMTPWITI